MNAKRFSLILLLILPVFSVPVTAEIINNVKVTQILVRPLGNNSIVKFDQNFTNPCSDNGGYGILLTDGTEGAKLAWSALLAAASSGKTLRIQTNGECYYHNVINEVVVNY